MIGSVTNTPLHLCRAGLVLLSVFLLASLSACGGTKVLTATKTVVHQDRIYNVSVVREVEGVREVILPDGEVQNLNSLDDRARRDLFDRYDEVRVRMVILFDENDLVYINQNVDNRRELSSLERRFDNAMERIRRFMDNRRQTQLELD